MTIIPIGNRAVIKLSKTQTTKSGLIVSLQEKTEQKIGEIIAIGKGMSTEDGNIAELEISVGDKVLVKQYGGETITDEQDETIEYKVVEAKDIIAVLK